MVSWQITATTILCNVTQGEVTIMVHKDGTLKCTGEKVATPQPKTETTPCAAATCPQVQAYRDKLLNEETNG